jgi:WD40 repeat protein
MLQKSPFKFLDSFTKDDRDIFFGRDKEIEELHSRVFESKILLVYGTSGTGKSSLINCGLANRFSDSDWLPLNIRRGIDINQSLFEALSRTAVTKTPFEKAGTQGIAKYNLEKLLRSVYLDHFRPVFLIFDQFEELFIFGRKDEKDELIKNVAKVLDSDIQCRFIFAMREEYLAGVTEFERVIPSFLSNRLRIEKMTRQNAIQTIEGPCRINNIEVETGFPEALLEKLNPDTPEVELTWLQIFLDKIMKLAEDEDHSVKRIPLELLSRLGDVKDILGSFLEEQISQLSDPETGLVVLKSFVSAKGTKRHINQQEVIEYSGTFGREIDGETIKELIQRFIKLRILRDKDEDGKYELRHDSLASKIYEKITIVEKELLEIKNFIDNAYMNYEKRDLLLSDEDLNYIAPYEDKLFLNEKIQSFIDRSKQAFQKARRRRQTIAIAAASIIIIVLSFFTIWAMRERGNAVSQQQIAEDQKNTAIAAKDEADAARQEAIKSRQMADSNAIIAIAARNQSEIARKDALAAKELALQQKSIAEKMSVVASEQARKAEEEKRVADSQRVIAQAAEEKAKRLSLLSTAQNLALKSMSGELKPVVKGLLAVQAYNFNKNNGGHVNDPVIFKALDKAYNILDSSKHSIIANPFGYGNEIRNLVEIENGIMGTDMDGNLEVLYSERNNIVTWFNKTLPDYIDFISLSPGGNKMIIDYENRNLIFQKITFAPSFNIENSDLQGHTREIKAAAWSIDGNYLITGGKDSLIKVWDTRLNPITPVKTLNALSEVKSLAFCNSDTLISTHADGSIILWDIYNSTSELLFSSENELPLCMSWNRSKKTVLAGCSNGILLIIDLTQKPYEVSRFVVHTTGIDQMVFSSDFSLLATASWDKVIRLYNYHEFFEMGNSVGGVLDFDDTNARARSLLITSDKKLVAGMSDKTMRISETSSEKLVSLICGLVNRNMTTGEWVDIIGKEIPYEKTCNINP